MLADSWVQLESEIREFLEGIYRATTAISTMAIGEYFLIQLHVFQPDLESFLSCLHILEKYTFGRDWLTPSQPHGAQSNMGVAVAFAANSA